jgi:hypothetical protein
MSLIPIAAELIRQAAADDNYSQDLYAAVSADQGAFRSLVTGPVEEDDLGWLSPSEWLWFAQWRQDLGGPLHRRILDHLDRALPAVSRVFRFDFRGLVMRDPASNDAIETQHTLPDDSRSGRQDDGSIGLQWVQRHAREYPDSLEVSRDALQYATPVAWYALRVLTGLGDDRAEQVRQWLTQIAAEREISPEITRLWQNETQGDTPQT